MQTPQSLGYRMPAEWEQHESTWLSWPKDPLTFPPGIIEKVESVYVEMVTALSEGEVVNILVDDEKAERRVRGMVADDPNVLLHRMKTADVWMRDYGPIFVVGKDVAATKWSFNAWGNKYEELLPDNRAGSEVASMAAERVFEPGIVLEGGSIDVNGRGSCLTTEQCLLNRNRNPNLSRLEIEEYLRDYLGVTNLVWLKRGIAGDDTDGHVDDLARFVGRNKVLCMVAEDLNDENHDALHENLLALRRAKDENGGELELVELPMPQKRVGPSERLPASYANFYIGNSVVLVPTFDDHNDEFALESLEGLFPGRRVVGLNCEPLVYGFGGIHCVTQQQPAASLTMVPSV